MPLEGTSIQDTEPSRAPGMLPAAATRDDPEGLKLLSSWQFSERPKGG